MKQERFADLQHELAAIDRQVAELLVKRASVFDELAEAEAHPRTGRRAQRPHVPPASLNVSSLDQARAAQALQQLECRRSLGK